MAHGERSFRVVQLALCTPKMRYIGTLLIHGACPPSSLHLLPAVFPHLRPSCLEQNNSYYLGSLDSETQVCLFAISVSPNTLLDHTNPLESKPNDLLFVLGLFENQRWIERNWSTWWPQSIFYLHLGFSGETDSKQWIGRTELDEKMKSSAGFGTAFVSAKGFGWRIVASKQFRRHRCYTPV